MKTFSNRELPEFKDIINRLNGVPSIKVAYAAAKTLLKIDQETQTIQDVRKEDETFLHFNRLLEEIKRKHALKREDGEPLIRMERFGDKSFQVYDIPKEGIKAYQDEAAELELKYKEVVDKQNAKEQTFNDLLNEPNQVEVHRVDLDDVRGLIEKDKDGKSKISAHQFVGLAFLLKSPITMDLIPDDINAEDMKILIEHFDL